MAGKRKNNFIFLTIYGIWSKEKKDIIFVSLDKDETELEYDMEGYEDATHALVCLETGYDISSLGLSDL